MNEKPIIFSPPMVKAILENKKTVTRRVITPQPPIDSYFVGFGSDPADKDTFQKAGWDNGNHLLVHKSKPKYNIGDVLWVRETFTTDNQGNYLYKSDPIFDGCGHGDISWTWKPSIHMKREAARIFLEVTSVRVERLQDISEKDAVAEGFEPMNPLDLKQMPLSLVEPGGQYGKGKILFRSYRASFYQFWEAKNKKRDFSWDSNPWVWVVEFRRIEK